MANGELETLRDGKTSYCSVGGGFSSLCKGSRGSEINPDRATLEI